MNNTKKKKVLLLGWDAADWKIINPLIDQGLMPNMKKLIENGTIANLATLDPPYSPMLWSSIATGKRPYKHGVHGFSELTPDGKSVRPVMSISRKCKAIWNILTQEKYKTHVVGWWPSHPAEPINGTMISNFFQQHVGSIHEPWPLAKGTVHPASKADFFAQFRIHPQELTGEHIVPFIPNAAKINQKQDKRIFSVAKITAHAASLHAAFTNIIRTEEWDFAALYLDAIDHYCHGAMRYHPPKRPHISQEDFDNYHYIVTAGYRYHDLMLGRIMELIDEETILMLVSDHGFQPDHLRPRDIPQEPAGPAFEHSPYGILAVMGPGIKKDHITFGASLLDIAPTILAAMGLPVGEDFDGKVIHGIFEKEIDIKTIPSWESIVGDDGMHKNQEIEVSENMADEALKQLEDLGYIEKQHGTQEQKLRRVQEECDFNLARAYMDGNLVAEAVPLLEKLYKSSPDTARYTFKLAAAYQAQGNLIGARQIIDELRAKEMYDSPSLDVMEGSLLMGERRPLQAIKLFKQAETQINQHHGQLNLQIARCYFMLQRWKDAEKAVEQELNIDPHNATAHHLLGRVLLHQKYFQEAADAFLNALGLDFNHPSYHHNLGQALFALGKYKEAAQSVENSLTIYPKNNGGRKLLMKIYQNHLDDMDKYHFHKKAMTVYTKETIYVVSGLPRSGTSMMMQMLEKGGLEIFTDGIRASDENNPKGYYEHEAIKNIKHDKRWIPEAENKAIKVIAQLLPQLPPSHHYKIIFMERDIHEVLSSQQKMLKRLGKKVQDEVYPIKLIETFENQLKKLKNWASVNEHVDILYVNHADIIQHPFEQALKINEFLGHRLLPETMVTVVDKTLYRERTKSSILTP